MRIAQVTLRFDAPGGVETVVYELTSRMRQRGEAVEVYASDLFDEAHWIRRPDARAEVDGIPVHRYPVYRRLLPGLTMPLMIGLVDGLAKAPPQLIHAHSHRYGHVLESALAARQLGVPFVVTTHYHPPLRDTDPVKRGLLRAQDHLFGLLAYREAGAVVAITEQERARLREFAPGARVRVIPHGIDLEPWSRPSNGDGLDQLPPLPPRYLLYAGRLASNKGLDQLILAVAHLPPADRLPIVFMGRDWGARPMLETLARRVGVEREVVWLDHVEAPSAYRAVFQRATVFVLPSEWEAFGLVLLEAMAAGVPVVSTAVGGTPEVLDGGRAGLLVPFGDPAALATAIRELLESPDRARALVRAARERVARYTWDRVVDEHLALYRELAG